MLSVLVVDDHPENCRPLVRLLKHVGREAACATSGEEALAAIHSDPPKVVLLDVMMPEMDGFEVLQVLRDDPRYKNLPIIMYSSLSEPSAVDRAMKLGANAYLVKARTNFDELVETLEHFMSTGA